LALTIPESLKRDVEQLEDKRIFISEVTGFTRNELSGFLKKNGCSSWVELPVDTREILRTPLIAFLYSKLNRQPN
jgi:hypothetical protein